MKSSQIIKSKSPKPICSNKNLNRPKNFLNKNLSKKYIYKKEKATDTDKVLQNNRISKNIVFNPLYNKEKDLQKSKKILNNSNCDLRPALEIRDDVNIDYDKYQQQQSLYIKSPSMSNFNSINNSTLLNSSFYLMNKKNGYMTSTNRNNNKWKCTQCGNVNSYFNYLCNNCNMPNSSLDRNNSINNSIIVNQRNKSTGNNLEAMSLDNNIINNSFNTSINNSSHNIFSKSINSNSIMKKQFLKKVNSKTNFTKNLTNYNSTNNLLSPYYSNMGYNTIRNNKNNNNYFYSSSSNANINPNNSMNSNNLYETEKDSGNITHLYSYSNYLANELKSSNDTNLKLLENYQTNESEYNNNYQHNDLIKKKIKILKEKEDQLNKINEQLQKSLSYIKEKYDNKNMDDPDGNSYAIKSLMGLENVEEFKSKIKEYSEENEKLSDKLKENKDIIIKLKTKIGELSDDKKSKNIDINANNQKLNSIKDLKEKINKYTEDIKEQNEKYNTLYNDNKALEQKIKELKKQISDEENNNNNNKVKQINSIPISLNNNENDIEKDKYLKNKEKNELLVQFFDQLNNIKNNKGNNGKKKKKNKYNKLKEIYLNINKNSLIELMKVEDKKEKEIIEIIDEYMNLLNEGIE